MKKIPKECFEHPEQYVPEGCYCYEILGHCGTTIKIKSCIFADKDRRRNLQANGYCHLLKVGDWMDGSSGLLWDGCKDCGINDDWE